MYSFLAWKVAAVTQTLHKKDITPKIGAKDYSVLTPKIGTKDSSVLTPNLQRKSMQDRVSSRVWEENVVSMISSQYRRY
jgi:hypothetical protein